MTDHAAILRRIADEVEEHPERWTTGTYARDANGYGTAARGPDAVCWCAYGFLARDAGNHLWPPLVHALKSVIDPDRNIGQHNDEQIPLRGGALAFVKWFRDAADLLDSQRDASLA